MIESLVSIVIPYYNKSVTINRAIDSIIRQTYRNWEIIIVDDKGIEPLQINPTWPNEKISVFVNENNVGAAQSRQAGQKHAKGEFIAFLDADDYWSDSFLSACIGKIKESMNCAGCYANVFEVHKEVIKKRNSYSGLTKIRETVIGYYRPWQTSAIVWKKEVIGNWGILQTREDAWFEITVSFNNNNLVYTDEANCYVDKVGMNHLSLTNGKINSILDQQRLFLMIYELCWNKLNLKSKIVLFNRLVQGQRKILRNCEDNIDEMSHLLFKLTPIIFVFRNNYLILTLIEKALQKSPFRVRV